MAAFESTPRSNAVQSASSRRCTTAPKAPMRSAEAMSEPMRSRRASARAAATANPPQPTMPPRFSNTPAVSPALTDSPAAITSRGPQLPQQKKAALVPQQENQPSQLVGG